VEIIGRRAQTQRIERQVKRTECDMKKGGRAGGENMGGFFEGAGLRHSIGNKWAKMASQRKI